MPTKAYVILAVITILLFFVQLGVLAYVYEHNQLTDAFGSWWFFAIYTLAISLSGFFTGQLWGYKNGLHDCDLKQSQKRLSQHIHKEHRNDRQNN